MPGILHYAPLQVSTEYLFYQINGLKRYTPVVLGKKPGKNFKYKHFYPLESNMEKVKEIVKRYDIRAIHAHFGHHGEKALALAQELKLPLITSIRGGEASNHPKKFKENKKRFSGIIRKGDLFLPVCQNFVPLLTNLGFPKDKIQVLYGGIDIRRFTYKVRQYNPKKIRIIFVGKTAPKKGLYYLIRAFHQLSKKYPNLDLMIISQKNRTKADREERFRLQQLIKKLGIEKKVNFKFDLREERIVRELHQAHIFAHPSITAANGNIEGIPNAIKEAMATGMPVVATKHAGIPELVEHRVNGLLVKEKEVENLAQALTYFIDRPDVWERYGNNARKTVEEKFNLYKQIEVQESYYDQLLSK